MNWSISTVLRLALLSKGFESFTSVSRPQDSFIIKSLDLKARFKVSLNTPVDRLLGMLDSNGSVAQHFLNDFQGLLFSLSHSTHYVIDQADALSLLTLNPSPSKDELFRQWDSDGPCKGLSSSTTRNQTPVGFRKAHFWTSSGDSDVSIECQLQSSTECWSINEAENGTVDVAKVIEDASEVVDDILNLVLSLIQALLKVCPSAEMALSAALEDNSS